MRVVVINLAERRDRLQAFMARWAAVGVGVDVEVFTAVRGRTGQAGCMASHLDVLRAGGDTPLLVLEDDACFAPGFTLGWPTAPPGWQLLRLGGHYTGVVDPVTPGWLRVQHVLHTHAYVARHPAQLAAQLITCGRVADASVALAALRRGQYAQHPPTVGQAGGLRSDIGGGVRPAEEFWH